MRPATDSKAHRLHNINHGKYNLNPHIAQNKVQKKSDSFLSYIQSFLNFFLPSDRKSTAKPAAKRSGKKTIRLVISKPKTKIPPKNVRIRRPPPQAPPRNQNKVAFRNPSSRPSKVIGLKSETDDSHQQVHKQEVKNLVAELHKTVHNILSQQNMNKPSNEMKTEVSGVPSHKKSAMTVGQVIPDELLSEPDQTLVDSPVIISPQTSYNFLKHSAGQARPQVREGSSRFEPFVPNYLELEKGGREGEIERRETPVEVELPAGPQDIEDCEELVSDCYEQLLDNKIVQLQGEMKRLESQYWGNEL